MIEQPTAAPPHAPGESEQHWSARYGKSIIFVILTLDAGGIYLALSIPISVFPETNFPRIVVGVDNGVAPIAHMLVTVTRPIEVAFNTVPGFDRIKPITIPGPDRGHQISLKMRNRCK